MGFRRIGRCSNLFILQEIEVIIEDVAIGARSQMILLFQQVLKLCHAHVEIVLFHEWAVVYLLLLATNHRYLIHVIRFLWHYLGHIPIKIDVSHGL